MRNLEYVCFMNRSGYAQAAMDYIYALKNGGLDLRVSLLHSTPDTMSITSNRYNEIMKMIQQPRCQDSVQIMHCIPDMQRRFAPTKLRVGFATFETFKPPEHWISILNTNDAIICPSKFNERVFVHAGITRPVFYIPHCFDPKIYNTSVRSERNNDEFTFLFFGTWKKRKGYEALIAAWLNEFDVHDKVRLVIKTDRVSMANKYIADTTAAFKEKKDFAPISFETKVLDEIGVPRLISSVDCLVSPTMGEGFGIPGLQAMALGVPIIITDFSGCQDYATADTSTLIKPQGHILINDLDGIPQMRGCKWAFITAQEVASKMRHAVNNKQDIAKKAAVGYEFVHKHFNYQTTFERFESMLEML